MNAVFRRRLEMAARVRDFLRAHNTDGVGQGLGLAKLEELIERAEVLAGQQRGGVAVARSATKQRLVIRRALQRKLLGYLRAVGAVAAKVNTELAQQFQMPPSNASQQALLTSARKILERATAEKEMLVGLGMSATVLDEVTGAIGELEQTLEATRAGRREHVGASADLKAVVAEVAEQVRLLDGVVKYRFGDNPELMGAWASARNVLGPFKPKNQPGADGSQTPKAA
jgi:uncharacterized protein YgfB (UPF0149 family)